MAEDVRTPAERNSGNPRPGEPRGSGGGVFSRAAGVRWQAPIVELRLIGEVRALLGGEQLDLGGVLSRTLLAALVLSSGQTLPKTTVMEAMWGLDAPLTADRMIADYMSKLRRRLAPAASLVNLRSMNPGFRAELDTRGTVVDVHLFRTLVRQADAAVATGDPEQVQALIGQALGWWPAQAVPLADLESTWARNQARVLSGLRLDAVERLARAHLDAGRPRQALQVLAGTGLRPDRENIVAVTILARLAVGETSQAVDLARRTRDRLVVGDKQPGQALAAALDAASRGRNAGVPSRAAVPAPADDEPAHVHDAEDRYKVPNQLPLAIADFMGRAPDIAALDTLASAGTADADALNSRQPTAVVISAIDGTAGIGKTTLAVHWAHSARERFPDGVLFTNLRGYGPGAPAEPGEVLTGFLRALGVGAERVPPDVDGQSAMYRSLLSGRRMLVVLDNVDTPARVRPLLPGAPGCMVVITSRSRLTGLVIAESATRLTLDLLSHAEALDLLRSVVGAARVNAEPDAADAMVRLCARLPLALRVVAARAAFRPELRLADVAAELADTRARMDTLSATGDEATDVRSVFAWSYRALNADQALIFRRLGLHAGPEIGVPAAASLADAGVAPTRRVLDELAEVHLVETATRDRYRLHDLLRDYAREQAENEDGTQGCLATLKRMLAFYLHTAEAADRKSTFRRRMNIAEPALPFSEQALDFSDGVQGREWYGVEHNNLMMVTALAMDIGQYDMVWQLAAHLHALAENTGSRNDQLVFAERALKAARVQRNSEAEAHLLGQIAYALTRLRRYADALASAQEALRLTVSLGDRRQAANIAGYLPEIHHGLGTPEKAIEPLLEAIEINREADDSWAEAISVNYLGDVYQRVGRPAEALPGHRWALDVFHARGDLGREGWTLRLLGSAYQALGQNSAAIENHLNGLRILHDVGYVLEEARILDALGFDHSDNGDFEAAQEYWRQAIALFGDMGDPRADTLRERLQDEPSAEAQEAGGTEGC